MPNLTRLLAEVALAIILGILVALSASDTVNASSNTSFFPGFDVTIASAAPEAPSDLVFEVDLPNGDVNFAMAVGFIPSDWNIVHGNEILVGAQVGRVNADMTLGLIGSPCNQILPVEFSMLNASLDQADAIDFEEDVQGSFPIVGPDFTDDWAQDTDGNGNIEAVDKWPEFIFRTLEDTQADPIRRTAGMAIVASTPVLLQFLTFEPGTFINENIANDETLGYPTVVLLQNFGDPEIEPKPSAITDFCTPLSSTATLFGVSQDNEDTVGVDESGIDLLVNPPAGTYQFTLSSAGLRDADGDGYENALDTCPLTVNVGNPRVSNDGDLDFDGLDAACDPNDIPGTMGGTNSDQDNDGYLNRQDNCPLVANGADTTNQSDVDEDQIGDACDPNPDNADSEGDFPLDLTSVAIVIGIVKGNTDCDSDVDAVDALKDLQFVAGLPVSQQPDCPQIGSEFASIFGDIDCDEDVDSVDSLFILRFVAALNFSLPAGCPPIGAAEAPPQAACVLALVAPVDGATLDNGRIDGNDDIFWAFGWTECPGASKYPGCDKASCSV